MNHIDEDDLLGYALETIPNPEEEKRIRSHLENCPECRALLTEIKSEINFISSIRSTVSLRPMPHYDHHESIWPSIMKAAALIILGVFLGMGASRLNSPEPVCVLPAYGSPSAAGSSENNYAVSEATGVKIDHLVVKPGRE